MEFSFVLNVILLIVGFVLLIKGADLFVDGASGIAGNFKVSKILIGLTIVAFGTSAPELAVSIKSIISGNADITFGNVIGSNVLNILLILGIASLIHPLVVQKNTVRKEIPFEILITVAFSVLLSDSLFSKNTTNAFTRGDGIILLLFFCVFMYYLICLAHTKTTEEEAPGKYPSMKKSVLLTIIGLIGIIAGGDFVVDCACNLASSAGISERIISLTIVTFGTSLPELITSVTASKKGEYDLAVGNIVGSNIFNMGMVIGLPVALFGGISVVNFSYVDMIFMLLAVVGLYAFLLNDPKISKKEGIIFLIVFAIYYSYVLFG